MKKILSQTNVPFLRQSIVNTISDMCLKTVGHLHYRITVPRHRRVAKLPHVRTISQFQSRMLMGLIDLFLGQIDNPDCLYAIRVDLIVSRVMWLQDRPCSGNCRTAVGHCPLNVKGCESD